MTDNQPVRSEPASIEAEAALLGGLMLAAKNGADLWPEVSETLRADDFHGTGHKAIFAAMRGLTADGIALEVRNVANALTLGGVLERIGGIDCLTQLVGKAGDARTVEACAAAVAEHSRLRLLFRIHEEGAQLALSGDRSAADLIAEAEDRLHGLARSMSPGEVLAPFSLADARAPLAWVWDLLIHRQAVALFCGPPKCGKSTAMRTLAHVMATGRGDWLSRPVAPAPAAYVDWENPGSLAGFKWAALSEGKRLDGLLTAHNARTHEPMALVAAVAREAADKGAAALFLDGMATLSPTGHHAAAVDVIGRLRRLAERHNLAIIATAPPLGSSPLGGLVDAVFNLARSDLAHRPGEPPTYSIECSSLRHGEPLPKTALAIDARSGAAGRAEQ